jgi:hypothetical protein
VRPDGVPVDAKSAGEVQTNLTDAIADRLSTDEERNRLLEQVEDRLAQIVEALRLQLATEVLAEMRKTHAAAKAKPSKGYLRKHQEALEGIADQVFTDEPEAEEESDPEEDAGQAE